MLNIITKFKNDIKGTTAVIFTICLFPLFAIVAFAVDYNEASRQRAILQSASDLAALYIAKLDDPKKRDKAQGIADEMVRKIASERGIVTNLKVNGTIKGKTVQVTANAESPNAFASALGYASITLDVLAESNMAAPKIEVGLVLDNSGSMGFNGGQGINALKPSTINLLKLFESMKDEGEPLVKTSFVTFDHSVLFNLPLSLNYSSLITQASSMTPLGATNVGEGMLASWEHLKKGDPKIKKFMIVLTDGTETDIADERLFMPHTCPQIRTDKNITLFMIGLGSDLRIQDLKDCAQNDKNVYEVKDYTKLDETFKKIFAEIAKLRLTR